jgi:phosphate/sulfate permease
MAPLLALSHHTGARLAEVAFLLILFAGIWITAAQIPRLRFASARSIVGGLAIAAAGLLLIIAAHWGHYG